MPGKAHLEQKKVSSEPYKEPLVAWQKASREQRKEELAQRRDVSYQQQKEEMLARNKAWRKKKQQGE